MAKCLARLTKWSTTSCRLASCMTVGRVITCKGIAKDGENLCVRCMTRPTEGRYQDTLIHGLLTEPIPEISRIYGGPWYWLQIDKHFPDGEPDNKEWLAEAKESQRLAEEFCGPGAWKVQRLSARELQMKKALGKAAKNKSPTETKLAPVKVAGTVLATFSPIKIIYEEDIADPVKMQTDTMAIRKEKFGDIDVWITANGLVFDCDTAGEPSELIGRYADGEFSDL